MRGRIRGGSLGLCVLLLAGGRASADELPRTTPGEILLLGSKSSGLLRGGSDGDPGFIETIARRKGLRSPRVVSLPGSSARGAFPGGAWVVSYEGSEDPRSAAMRFAEDPDFAYAGPNHVLPTASADSLFSSQWALEDARVPPAWERSRGSGVLVAVIDTGVDVAHPDLAANIAVNAAERDGRTGVDDDGNGYTDDVWGYDFTDAPTLPGAGDYLDRDSDPADDHGHGTEVAGVVSAVQDNRIGITGVAPHAEVLAVRAGFRTRLPFLGGLLQEDDAASAILYAASRGARVINLSWGDVVEAPIIREAVAFARESGCLVVAAAGNNASDGPFFPSGHPGVLAVGASSRQHTRSAFSSHGQALDLLAPGVSVLTTRPENGYIEVSGTSFSSPMTAAVAALVWSLHPEWTADQVAWRIRLTADGASDGWNPEEGWGFLDAAKAVEESSPPPVVQVERFEPAIGDIAGTVAFPDLVSWSLSALREPVGESPEKDLVSNASLQVVEARLAEWSPLPEEAGDWVIRLVAHVAGLPLLEERSRWYVPPPRLSFLGFTSEAQAGGDRGWDVVLRWMSEEPHQGSALAEGNGVRRFAEERPFARSHAVRITGPLPEGTLPFQIWGRRGPVEPLEALHEGAAEVPSQRLLARGEPGEGLPPGTPMRRSGDWNGNGFREVVVETPITNDLYGSVYFYEVADLAGPSDLVMETSFRGIPLDAADTDADGLTELVVFRLNTWTLYEPRAAGEFPIRNLYSEDPRTGGVPVGFSGGTLLSVLDRKLLLFGWEGDTFKKIAEAESPGSSLVPRGAVGDLDDDGLSEAALADADGRIALFRIEADRVVFLTLTEPRLPVLGDMVVAPGEGGDVLVTLESDPPDLEAEGDLERASLRLRTWRLSEGSLTFADSLAMTGFPVISDIEILLLPGFPKGTLLLRRGPSLDVVTVSPNGTLRWGGNLSAPSQGPIHGVLALPFEEGVRLWLGASSPDVTSSDDLAVIPQDVGASGRLRVVSAVSIPGAVALDLAREPDACGPKSFRREGDVRGAYDLEEIDGAILDTVSLGERVTYTARAGDCVDATWNVLGRSPQPLVPAWSNGRLLAEFVDPLQNEPEELFLVGDGRQHPPSAVFLQQEGRSLLVTVDDLVPDSLIVGGVWDRNGLPLGGRRKIAAPVPTRPLESAPITLAAVTYLSHPAPRLLVTLSGGSLEPACPERPEPFLLEPEGWRLDSEDPGQSGEVVIPLPSPLSSGRHTLRLESPCYASQTLGVERAFNVGIRIFPNPVLSGQGLTVENVEPGSEAVLLDLSGMEIQRWILSGSREVLEINNAAPGMYLLRVLSAEGQNVLIERIGVIR